MLESLIDFPDYASLVIDVINALTALTKACGGCIKSKVTNIARRWGE